MILLILSLVLLVVSNLMKNNPPTKINSFYGFRTKKSMKNEKSWHLAQKLLGDFS
ncbi:TPA: SdpI family protein, partial [Enterococcus faecium]|nr:SdpI family protein [Enterococcus faecium]HAP9431317.1 SdpI family protein [Enterococcus faecium]HAZ9914708.1 SdpI family protein [Enterococcus faecium]HEG4153896.1 SdpI family protein [Enterococcus faecium]HEG4486337.1 SdpI family protein [Enterococcus faecium]